MDSASLAKSLIPIPPEEFAALQAKSLVVVFVLMPTSFKNLTNQPLAHHASFLIQPSTTASSALKTSSQITLFPLAASVNDLSYHHINYSIIVILSLPF
jgi:hypothetical protein